MGLIYECLIYQTGWRSTQKSPQKPLGTLGTITEPLSLIGPYSPGWSPLEEHLPVYHIKQAILIASNNIISFNTEGNYFPINL